MVPGFPATRESHAKKNGRQTAAAQRSFSAMASGERLDKTDGGSKLNPPMLDTRQDCH